MTNLTRKHSGELVAVDHTRDKWRLLRDDSDFAKLDWSEQFWCFEGGKEVQGDKETRRREHKQWDPSLDGQAFIVQLMNQDRRDVCDLLDRDPDDLLPDWDSMRFRHVCPCVYDKDYVWIRTAVVASLGELFMILGKQCTAAEIYGLYRTLRIVCLKRRKDRSGNKLLGSARSGTAGPSVRKTLRHWKELLIEEYATLMGKALPAQDDKRANSELFEAAVQYIHANLLQDLSPPWIGHQFSQALPGDGVLCRYLKPTFLRWNEGTMPALFGVQVHYTWTHKCKQVGLELAAVVGRPLYMCTCTKSNGKMCGMLAAMSPLMEQKDKHKPFSCKDCASHHVAEHQALPVRRLLRLYAQVRVDDKCVAMRSTPMHILVYAPKDDAVWGIGHQAPDQMSDKQPVSPKRVQILNNTGFEYDERDSENIWMHATHFQNLDDH